MFILFTTVFSEKYVAQSKEEEIILNNLRKIKLKFGLSQADFYNEKFIDNESINDIVKELFSNYLGLNIVYEKLPCSEKYENLKNSKLMGSAFINRDYQRNKYIDFSQTIYNDNLYVISTKEKIGTVRELPNQDIYSSKGSLY